MNKITPPGDEDWYDIPLSKYGPTRWAYGPTHYGMGHMTATLTFEASQATGDLDLIDQGRGHRYYDQERQPTTREQLPTSVLSPRRHRENMR
jgi:hypothetical protein